MQYRRVFFRVVYGSSYFALYLILAGLLLITPGDVIQRSIQNKQNYNVLIVIISYVVTVVIVVFIYVLRLYINKTALAAIPKAWVPIEKGDVKDAVYMMVGTGLSRSAAIAYEARPRAEPRADTGGSEQDPAHIEPRARIALKKTNAAGEEVEVTLPPHHAVWGEIEHCGWASPNSPDLPNLQYSTVLSELPNLIEAKALTMAPSDRTSAPSDPPLLDPEATELLQRMPNMGLREYVDHLADVGVVNAGSATADFLAQYEHARFSTRPLSNAQFRQLMHLFAEMLRAMRPLDLGALGGKYDDWAPSESDIDNDAPRDTNPPSPRSSISRAETASTRGSVRRPVTRNLSLHEWGFRTAPNTPGSRRTGVISRQSSNNSFAQTRRPYSVSQPSSSSLRSQGSSADSGSVIRLATRDDPDELPYVLNLTTSASS